MKTKTSYALQSAPLDQIVLVYGEEGLVVRQGHHVLCRALELEVDNLFGTGDNQLILRRLY